MGLTLEEVLIFLLIASIVSILTQKLHVPYSVGLVLTGITLSLLSVRLNFSLPQNIIFNAFLPPLIFEAALFLPWKELKKEFLLIFLMATLGVVLSACVVAVGMHYLSAWPWMSAGIFGILIAATDPVSVIATFKEARVKGRLRLLVESESLFNDGTAAAAFGILMSLAQGDHVTFMSMLTNLTCKVGGGMACGAIIALLMLYLAGQTKDHLIEITFTMFTAYASFLFAERIHASGVLATLTAGLIVGNSHSKNLIKSREAVESFWEYAAFIANSLIFLLIGIHEAVEQFPGMKLVLIAIFLILLGRALAVYPICMAFSRHHLKVSKSHQHILFWGGLRGALGLALALGLPDSMPFRESIVSATFAIVAFSIIVQGMTITPFMRSLGELPSKGE
jgi:CPA1 family monovalent cation:H+ antiporter